MGVRVVGASVRGPSHERRSTGCQDKYAVATSPPSGLVIAVADGLGSAPLSALGAHAAVEGAVAAGAASLRARRALPSVARAMAAGARRGVELLAVYLSTPLMDLACTTVAVAARGARAAVAHVGDGGVVASTPAGLVLASGPAPARYVEEVDPITTRGWRRAMRVSDVVGDVECLAVFTDGCQRAALAPAGAPHPGFFDPLFSYVRGSACPQTAEREIAGLLDSRKMREHSDDDKTLVVAVLINRSSGRSVREASA